MEKCLSGAKVSPGQVGKGIRKAGKTKLKKGWSRNSPDKTPDRYNLHPSTKVFWKGIVGGRSPKWHLRHPLLLPGVLGRLWQDEVEPGAFLGLGREEQATQGVLKPKGFFRSPAEKRCFLEQAHVQAARFVPQLWSQQPGEASPGQRK